MAVNIGGNKNTEQKVDQSSETAFAFQNQKNTNQPKPKNIFDMLGVGPLGSSLPMNMGSDFTNKLNEGLNETFKQVKNAEIKTIVIDNAVDKRLVFSVIIIAQKNPGDQRVAYHTLILEPTGDKLQSVTENIEGVTTEILRLASDAMDLALINIVNETMTTNYPGHELISVDGCVVPRNFDINNSAMILRLAHNATLATGTELMRTSGVFPDLSISDIKSQEGLQINMDNVRNVRFSDAVGEPVRADLQIRFETAPKPSQNRFGINAKDRQIMISEITSFIDFFWAPVQVNPMMMYSGMAPAQKFMAQQIITNINSSAAFTPSALMLYIASAMTAAENNNWMFLFRPSIDQDPMNDVAALNYEGNIGGNPNELGPKLDLLNDPAGVEAYYRFMTSLVRPGLSLAIDVPDFGPQTWFTSVLMAAGAKNNQKAKRIIYDSLMSLTGGVISRFLKPEDTFFAGAGERIHLGYYTNKNGIRRDIRDIDYLVVANHFGESNPQAVRDWADTFTLTQHNQYKRLAARKRFIKALTNEDAEFTGMATRLTFSLKFIEAVSAAIRESQLPVMINNPLAANAVTSRGVMTWADQALGVTNQTFISPMIAGSTFSGPGMNSARW